MKICYLGDSKSIHVQRWAKYFIEKKHEVHIISLNDTNLEGIFIHPITTIDTENRALWYLINLYPIIIQVRKFISKINPNILHAHYAADYGIFGSLSSFHPFIVSVWGSDVLLTPKKWKIWGKGISYALKKADCITTIPEFMKGYLVNTFNITGDKIIRIPWGIDLTTYFKGYEEEVNILQKELSLKKGQPVILSNRSINQIYNIENIIDAIPKVLEIHKDAIFIFIKGYASEEYFEKIKSKIGKLGIAQNVRIIENLLTPKEMAVYLNLADMTISVPKVDQFASSIMETMACGAIPIVGDLEVYKQYLTDKKNAFFVDQYNPDEISQTILFCIENLEKIKQILDINLKIIEENENWIINARRMEFLYDKIMKRSD